jgi:hypothetical protein
LERESYPYAAMAGLVMGILTFLNISLVPLILFCGWLALGYHALLSPQAPRLWSLQIGAAFGVGLALVWLAWMLYGGPDPYAILHTALSQHLELDRPYLPWLVLHLWDYGLFLGLPVFFLSLYGLWRQIRTWRQERVASPALLLALAWGLTLLILNLSGTARGETGRVWQFFFPFSLLIALSLSAERGALRALWLAQASAALVIVWVIGAVGTGLEVPPQSPPIFAEAQITQDSNTRFGDSIHLTGFGGEGSGDGLQVDLRWQAERWPDQPYYMAIIPVAPDGQAYGKSLVLQPFEAAYPTSCWQPDQTILQRVTFPLEGNPPQGQWWVSLSMHDYTTYDSLPVTLPDGTIDRQAGLGPFTVE